MADTTVLNITGLAIPPYSARGLRQTLTPISALAVLRRTINGKLIDLSPTQFRKYRSTISGNDQQPPAFNGLWIGAALTVDCIEELSYLTAGGSPERSVVSGSSRVEGDFTFFRPQIPFIVTNFSMEKQEYEAMTSWQLDLEEQ